MSRVPWMRLLLGVALSNLVAPSLALSHQLSARSRSRSGGSQAGQPSAPLLSRGKLAVVISGLKTRFILNSTLERVVGSSTRAGYQVDVYLSLVEAGDGQAFSSHGLSDPGLAQRSPEDLRTFLRDAIAGAGGQLVHYEHSASQEELAPLPEDLGFMYDYPPQTSPFGRNVLRRWKSSEALFNETLRRNYDFVLWEREDQYWLKPLWLFNFRGSEGTVYAKNCLGWGGINDKSLLLGRVAAGQLMTAYSAFWSGDQRLRSRNAEQFLKELAISRGIAIKRVPFPMLPSTDATFALLESGSAKPPALCIKEFYSCEQQLPAGSPPFCPVGK